MLRDCVEVFRAVLRYFFTLILSLRLRWHVFYQKFNQNWFLPGPSRVTTTTRRIISIGDGFARCVGETAIMGSRVGLANRVNDLLDRKKTGSNTLHMRWECIDRGEYGYTSDDWLPRDNSLFEKLFAEEGGDGVDADVVLMNIGAEDCRCVPQSSEMKPAEVKKYAAQVVRNIAIVATTLADLDKIVYVGGIRCGTAQNGRNSYATAAQLEINTQLKNTIKELGAKYPNLHMGPTNQGRLFEKKLCYCFDGQHPSGHGYSLLARNWVNAIAPGLQKFEYDFVKENVPRHTAAANAANTAKLSDATKPSAQEKKSE